MVVFNNFIEKTKKRKIETASGPIIEEKFMLQHFEGIFIFVFTSVAGSLGALNKIEMPRFMNGFVKSMTLSRA